MQYSNAPRRRFDKIPSTPGTLHHALADACQPRQVPDRTCARTMVLVPPTPARITGGLLVGRLPIVNPLVPTPMDVVAGWVGLAITVLMLSVLVALAVRVTRRRREPPSTPTIEAGR